MVQFAMLADGADESLKLIRYLDDHRMDQTELSTEIDCKTERLNVLFVAGDVVHSGYTRLMLSTLRR
eukprot:11361748-Alexandrium_andersonii.AAC.1